MLVKKCHPLGGRMLFALFLLSTSLTLLAQAAAFPDWTDCPAVCRCKWTSGKKSALCPDAGLTTLPAYLDPDMQVLDLSGNKIPALQSEVFKSASLVNLQKVFLRKAGIREIHPDSFKDMRILVEVDLTDNSLTELDPNTFSGNERLRVLTLTGNPIRVLKRHQFPALDHLKNLDLNRCSLTEIHGEAFINLKRLESLNLDLNELEYLDATVIQNLEDLKTLGLEGNQWNCDCRLRSFRAWLIPTDTPNSLYSTSQKCQAPKRLKNRRWEDVKPVDFACEPEVTVTASSTQEEINGNLSLSCLAKGDPEPEVWWQLNGGPVNITSRSSYSIPEQSQSYVPPLPPVILPAVDTHNVISDSFTSQDSQVDLESIIAASTLESTGRRVTDKWNNLTVYNASDGDAGEYACFAKNNAGVASDTVNIAIPQVYTAPTLSQTDNWLLWVSLAGGGAAALCASITVVLLALCLCDGSRRACKRDKVKLQSSTSFGDQEKKLLDLSVTTTTVGGNSIDRASASQGSFVDTTCSSGDLELSERDSICDPMVNSTNSTSTVAAAAPAAAITIERLRPEIVHVTSNANTISRKMSCSVTAGPNVFPPPPPEFTGPGILPSNGVFGNIFISVSMPRESEHCYPDLLDIPVHGLSNLPTDNRTNCGLAAATSSNFATLPRRSLRPLTLGSPYDNMGPRTTANGSSTFSIHDSGVTRQHHGQATPILDQSPPTTPTTPHVIEPPHQFVSL